MPTAPSCPTTSYHNSSGRSLKRPLDLHERRTALPLAFGARAAHTRIHAQCSTSVCGTDTRAVATARTAPHPVRPCSLSLAASRSLASPDPFPLRLVPEGNKDGSAYVQPATGGGARLPSVGRTNANDSSMQDGAGIRRAAPFHSARKLLLYLACNVAACAGECTVLSRPTLLRFAPL